MWFRLSTLVRVLLQSEELRVPRPLRPWPGLAGEGFIGKILPANAAGCQIAGFAVWYCNLAKMGFLLFVRLCGGPVARVAQCPGLES